MSGADACPCGTGRALADCCGPYLDGTALPPTAEALMRSRYSAYALAKVDYIKDTHDVLPGDEIDHDLTARWARESEWLGLEILSAVEDGNTGQIEFRARYRAEGAERVHHEKSRFHRKDGRWFFVDGTPVKPVPLRAEAKAGRNAPCPCGSGKKFKRCHGA